MSLAKEYILSRIAVFNTILKSYVYSVTIDEYTEYSKHMYLFFETIFPRTK